MSLTLWDDIQSSIDSHGYMSGIQRKQSRVKMTAEVFTPAEIVIDILKNIPIDNFAPGKNVLDPACGDGQFLAGAKAVKILHFGMSEEMALQDLYGVDIMRDNVQLCRTRLGGGTVVHGDALNPKNRLQGQSDHDYELMLELFSTQAPEDPLALF